uniref:YqaJ viral recombinase domain-containing protein n=1 Tax=Schizaphis graminum TaxID=13262 RepID=A0A2S2PE25_SCHGA
MYGVLNLGDCCQTIYDSKIKLNDSPINIRTKSLVDKSYWHQIRQFKITGSRCYSLFTYYTASKKTDAQWALKASKYFWPNTFSNKFVKHGIKYESVAIELFARDSKQKIVPCGFVTSYNYPWLGYSPDGIIVNNFNEPTKLVEIKCPYLGSTVGLQNVIEKVKFISKNTDGSLTLNKKDSYYAQVQLGLVLLNLSSCDFVVYNSLEHSYIVINVEFDFHYCKILLQVLKIVYFEKLLHTICELQN